MKKHIGLSISMFINESTLKKAKTRYFPIKTKTVYIEVIAP